MAAYGEFGVGGSGGALPGRTQLPSGRKHLFPGVSQGAAQPHRPPAWEHL